MAFGEALRSILKKDVSALSLPEAAFLTGADSWSPTSTYPYQHPERAAERRIFVLGRMRETGLHQRR